MLPILRRLRDEPAFVYTIIATVGQLGLQLVSMPDQIELPLVGFFGLFAAAAIRSRVTPTD